MENHTRTEQPASNILGRSVTTTVHRIIHCLTLESTSTMVRATGKKERKNAQNVMVLKLFQQNDVLTDIHHSMDELVSMFTLLKHAT